MNPSSSDKLSLYHFAGMPLKKRITICFVVLALILWIFNITTRPDGDDCSVMKAALEKYEMLLKETRDQVLGRLQGCRRSCPDWSPDIPIIYVITPTYTRPVQKAELTRLSHTLMLVSNLHWIIVEDAREKTDLVENLLLRSELNFTHLNAATPDTYKVKGSEPKWHKHRGVEQRNTALRWIRKTRTLNDLGVVYFADDDNSYSLEIFNEMRWTKEVSVWPVGLVGGLMVERPLVNSDGKVSGFNSAWRPDRDFPLDMAGFAINLNLILSKSHTEFLYNVSGGFQESVFLKKFTTMDRLEPLADNCTKVYVWHTRTEAPKLPEEKKLRNKGLRSDIGIEV